jgi:hypothetical protein
VVRSSPDLPKTRIVVSIHPSRMISAPHKLTRLDLMAAFLRLLMLTTTAWPVFWKWIKPWRLVELAGQAPLKQLRHTSIPSGPSWSSKQRVHSVERAIKSAGDES